MFEFNVGDVPALLGLALYILAYGLAPMILSPLSEMPRLGRMGIYIVTFAIFVILNVPTSLVQNFAGLLVLRFLLGFFGSPALATGVATLSDMYSPLTVGYAISLWGASITVGPALGPVISGFAVQAKGWRWSSWELLWMSGPVLIAMFFFLPETSADAILMQRARRLRRITGRTDLKSQSEINQANMSAHQVLVDALIKPFEINALDPSVLFTTFYIMLIHGILYSFFESFPIVYTEMYGLNLGETSLLFLCICVSLALAVPAYMGYLYFVAIPAMQTQLGFGSPEARLLPGVIGSFLVSTGLFIFAWTARGSINYFVSVFGVLLSFAGVFPIIQSMFLYLAFTYPMYAASLFAANDFARSTFAAAAVLFSTPMYDRLGVDGGVSLLAGLTVLCIVGMFVLYFFGANLRARSRFAVKPNL